MTTIAYCPQCQRETRVTEAFAFGGADKLRSTLACGHIVARQTHATTVARSGGHGYPYRAECACGWSSKSYAATHAAAHMGAEHLNHTS